MAEITREKRQGFCPEHGDTFRCREGQFIICCQLGCNFRHYAKRQEDMNLAAFGKFKEDFNG